MATFEESAAPASTSAPEFYTWTFPGAPVRIHLHLNVVESLGREVRRAFESVPSHSIEIGGLLLGTADFASSPIIEIKDFEPFLCEYRSDHKFILSDSDQRKLEKVLDARRSESQDPLTVVGYYRSHLGEGLSLRQDDVAIAQAHFCDPANVFLLMRPAADGSESAGFFFWDGGRIDAEFTFLEFPFDARLLAGSRAHAARLAPADSYAELESAEELPVPPRFEIPPEDAPSPHGLDEPQKRHSRGPHWLWYPLFALSMLALGAVGYQGYLKWSAAEPAAPVPIASDAPVLAMQVERRGGDLRVSWNRTSPAVVQAKDAVLSIRDGESQQQELHLDLEQLRSGSVLYTPANNTVQFRLEITAPDNSKASETVLALTADRPGAPSGSAAQAAGGSPRLQQNGSGQSFGEPVRVILVDPPADSKSSVDQSTALMREPPSGPAVADVPARPIRQSRPALPPSVRSLITSQVEVNVKVSIDETGRVTKAELLPGKQPVDESVLNAARKAAAAWRFAPAQRGGQPVPSELILRFQFRPTAPRE
jgi:TonB family protein